MFAVADPANIDTGKMIIMGIGIVLIAVVAALVDHDSDPGNGPGSGVGGPDVFG